MAIIKKFSPFQNLSNFQVFLNDSGQTSDYFRVTEFEDSLTGGKNGFLIEGSEFLKESTEVKIEILDVEGNPIYFEPGDGVPEYYEGNSKLVSIHVYDDTPIGQGKITILGELKEYVDDVGATVPIPDEWKGVYNVKWERTFQVNKNLNNETIVRFYKRPIVSITELVKPIFSKSIPTVTDTGTVHGISETPIDGTDISTWRAGTLYKLSKNSGSWDRDVDENVITITNPSHEARIIEVLNDREVLVDIPYSVNNIVSNFTSGSYSVTYSDFQNEVIGESTLTGSFAKIDISQLKTFVGDVARVKVFRKSRNAIGDFQFVQESKLESTELLRDITTPSNTEIPYGRFDESNLETYWVTSSDDHPISIDSSKLSQAVKFDYDSNVGGVQRLITSQSLSISKDVEYTLNFRTLLSGSLSDTGKNIRAFFSSSDFTQDFLTVSGSAIYRTRQNVSQNIISENSGSAHLVFEVKGEDWYISNVSLKNAQDTSFSPDEFTLIQDIPRKLPSETFDFKFEFYDINNNYIPVDVIAVGVFDGGNDFPTSGKLLTFESDRNAFRFTSGSLASPSFQQLQFKITQNNLTGSVTFASAAFDVDGNYIEPSTYSGDYPGLLTNVTPAGAILTVANFSGSVPTTTVGSIVYTASLEDLEEFETVYRLEDGDNAPTLLVTSNANQFTYEPTSLTPKPIGQEITVRAQRKNLASLVTPITVNSGSNTPPLTYVDTVGGIDTYTISATAFSESFSANSFDEVKYEFTGSDVFGVEQTDEITLSKVINFDGVSITLSNESTAFRANGQGLVLDSFDSGNGNVQVRIASHEIQHSNGLSVPNSFDITSATATNVTEAFPSYLTDEYGISALSSDSGSLVLNISVLSGDNETTQSFQKQVNYTKNRIAEPSITIDTTNKNQNVDAKSTGVQKTSFDDSTITIREFYTGSVTTFSSSDVVISFDSNPNTVTTDNGDLTFSYSNLGNSTNSAQVQFTATVTDSEGQSRSVTDSVSLSKTLDAAPNVEVQAFPSAQSIQADSNGSGSVNPVDLSLVVSEGGTTRTITGIGTITKTGGLDVETPTSPFTTIEFSSDASDMTSDTGTLTIPVQTTNSEGTSITKDVVVTVTRLKQAAPSVIVSANIPSQVVTANSAGTQTGTLSNVIVSALEGGTSVFTSMTVAGSTGFDSTPTISSNTLQLSSRTLSSDTGTVTLTVNYTDSEGIDGSQSLVVNASKVEQPADAVNVTPSITSQNIGRDVTTTPNTFDSVQDISFTVVQGSTTYTAIPGSSTLSNETYKVKTSSLSNCTEGGDGIISPTQPTTSTFSDGGTASFTIQYKDGTGGTNEIDFTHVVTVTPSGQTGPGIVHTGVWEDGRVYQFSTGATGRRDSVLWSSGGTAPYDRYYASKRQHTSDVSDTALGGDGPPHVSTNTWEDLGTEDLFVAAKIGIFEDSFVQNTLNIGSNNSGGVHSSNITLYGGNDSGGSTNPYISIGQSGTVGSQGYNVNGIFMGLDSGTAKFSVKNGTQFLQWDGTDLNISGDITVTNPEDFAEPTFSYNFAGDASQILDTGIWNINGGVTQTPETTGIGFTDDTSNTAWDSAVVAKRAFLRSNGPRLEWDFKILKTDTSANRYEMLGWGESSTMINHTNQAYAIYIHTDDIYWRTHSSGTNAATAISNVSVDDTFRLRIRLKTGGGAFGELFKNGDFTEPISTYDWGSTGTETSLYIATTHRDNGSPRIEHQSVQVGLPSGIGTVISGNTISTGVILSNNWGSAAGSRIDLDNGTIELGGYTSPNFSVTSAGHVTAKGGGSIAGWSITDSQLQSSNLSGGGDGTFTTAGILINEGGYISSPGFSLSSGGSARFSGAVEGSSITGGTIVGGSINVPNSTNPLFSVTDQGIMSATDAVISGSISANDGTLGNWTIDPPDQGGSLRDEDSQIILNPTDKRIQLFNSSQELKAQIRADDSLTSAFAGNLSVSGIGTSVGAPSCPVSSTTTSALQFGSTVYSSSSNTFTPTASGEYTTSFLFQYTSLGSISLSSITPSSVSVSTGNPSGNFTQAQVGPSYSSQLQPRYYYQYRYLEIVRDSDDTVVKSISLGYAYTGGAYTINNYYFSYGSGGLYEWQSAAGYNGSSFAYESTVSTPIQTVVNLDANVDYYARYSQKLGSRSASRLYLDGTDNPFTTNYDYITTPAATGVSSTSLDSSFTLNQPSNFVELSGGGFQALTNADQFVKITREDPGDYTSKLIDVEGGRVYVDQSGDRTRTAFTGYGHSQFYGQTTLGPEYGWGEQNDNYGRAYTNIGTPTFRYRHMGSGTGGSSTSPYYLNPMEDTVFIFGRSNPSNSNRHYELPHYTLGPSNQSNNVPFREKLKENTSDEFSWGYSNSIGAVVILVNMDSEYSYKIGGFNGRADDDGWFYLPGGRAVWCVFTGTHTAYDNGTTRPNSDGGWMLMSYLDDNINSW